MKPIEAIVSDFGGVLTTPLLQAFAALQSAQGIPLEALGKGMARATEQNSGIQPLHQLETGAISERQFTEQLGAAISDVLGYDVALDGVGATLFAALHPNDQLFAFMRSLHGRGYRMAILTNNVREWEARWRSMLPIDEIFELVIDSAFVGLRKPDPAIYELLLERLGVAAEATVFLDDLEVNCEAARALGMNAVRFEDNEQAIAAVGGLLERAALSRPER